MPLGRLFYLLEREGFIFGIDTHLYVQTLLQQEGASLRESPEKIKYLLCPILAQSKEEQKKFYRIFDAYYAEVERQTKRTLADGPDSAEQEHSLEDEIDRIIPARRFVPWIVAGFILAGLGFFLYLANKTYDLPKADFVVRTQAKEIFRSLPDSIGGGQDTIQIKTEPGERFSFHYTPLEDTLGLDEAELIWIFGDGRVDTIRERAAFFDTLYHTYSAEKPKPGVYLVQLLVRQATSYSTLSLKKQEVAIKHARINLTCPDAITGQINWLPREVMADQEIDFGFQVSDPQKLKDYTLEWDFGDGVRTIGASPKHVYLKGGDFKVEVSLRRKIAMAGPCGEVSKVFRYITVSSHTPKVELEPDMFPLKADEAGSATYHFTPLAHGLIAALITLLLVSLGLLIRVFTYKRPQLEDQYEAGDRGPYILPLPKQDHLIAPDRGVYDLASVMRQRQVGNIFSLNMPVSIQKTIRESGLPILHFDVSSRPSEYLVLIHQHHPESHLARFFGRITKILQDEDVLLETFYYDQDPRTCWNEDYPQGLSLAHMQKRYNKHRLILFSDGHHLINPSKSEVYPWVADSFATWKENRILLTPTPVADWGYRERLVMEQMDVLPLDIPGQMQMIEMFEEEGQPEFEAHQKRMRKLFPAAAYSIRAHDVFTVEGLRAYLDPIHPELFRWVAATMVYPQPRWEITLGIGHALSAESADGDKEFLLTFENLLTLARIPWLQNQVVPSALRQDLLRSLDPQTEALARTKVLELIDQIDMDPRAMVAQEWAIQRTTQRFFLQPGDPETAREMYYLMEADMLEDTEIRKRMEEPSDILDGKAGKDYLEGKFGMLRPREYFMGGLIGLAVFFLAYFLQTNVFSLTPPVPDDPSLFQASMMITQQVDIDRATQIHNQGVIRAEEEDLIGAVLLIDSALNYRPAYPLADSNQGKLLYRLGVQEFNRHEYGAALSEFSAIGPPKHELEVYKYALGAKGLCFYYLAQNQEDKTGLDSARAALEALIAIDEAFALSEFPHLYEYLQKKNNQEDLFDFHFKLAQSFFEKKAFERAKDHLDTALNVGTRNERLLTDAKRLKSLIEKGLITIEQDGLATPVVDSTAQDSNQQNVVVPDGFYVDPLWVEELRGIVERMEAQQIMYNSDQMADVSGIYHRIMDSLELRFPRYQWADAATHRSTREIAQWYNEKGKLTIVRDAAAYSKLIQPGAVVFFSGSGKKVRADVPIRELIDDRSDNKIVHMGIVTQVETNRKGDVLGYTMMHGRAAGKPAARTNTQKMQQPFSGLPDLGNYKMQWVAIAPPSPDEPSPRLPRSAYDLYREKEGGTFYRDIYNNLYDDRDQDEFMEFNELDFADYAELRASRGELLKIPKPQTDQVNPDPTNPSPDTESDIIFYNGQPYVYNLSGDQSLVGVRQGKIKGSQVAFVNPGQVGSPISNQLEQSRMGDGLLYNAVLGLTGTQNSFDAMWAVLRGCGYYFSCENGDSSKEINAAAGKVTGEYRLFFNTEQNKLWVGEFYNGQMQEMRGYSATNPVFDDDPEPYESITRKGDPDNCGNATNPKGKKEKY